MISCILHVFTMGKTRATACCLKTTIELNSSPAQEHVCLQVVQVKEWQEHFIHDFR